jgi:NADP-dependent 3-hydroxy acid dehydrogenase YdfG
MQNLPKRRESANARNDATKASSKAWPRIVKSPQGVYAATKTAVKALTEGLRQESGPDLRVTLVSPGFTNTEGVGKGATPEAAVAMARQRDEIAIPPSAIASAIGFAIDQPVGVDISEVVVRPTVQA